jgi:acyl-CoA synthetase (AMP-forming)/AMP-acid ligase II
VADGTDATPLTIPTVLRRAAERYADVEGMVDGDVRWSFPELVEKIGEAARAMIASGVEPGDRVAIWAPNSWEWAVTALGCQSVGGVVTPLNTRFKGNEAGDAIGIVQATRLFTVTDFLGTNYVDLLGGAPGGESIRETVVLRGAVPAGCIAFDDFLARGHGVSQHEADARAAAVRPDDLCDVLFTSGTTGRPKGAMLFHAASIRAFDTWCDIVGLRTGDRYLVVSPFFHTFGVKAGILASLLAGATIIPHPVFDVPAVMRRVAEERVTVLPGAPAVFQAILNHPERAHFDLSSLRLTATGASSVPTQLVVDMREQLGFETVVTGYGLTETHGVSTMCRHDDAPEVIAKTVGRPLPGVEVRVVDAMGNALARGEQGEVVIRGYNLMKGYYDDPEATADAIDAEGWLHTGDIAYQDDGGNLVITDRLKDMFIVGGFNAYPAEIENIMSRHAAVASVAVVGVPDARLGEVGMAFVVPATGTELDTRALVAWCRENMANYKVPRYVEFVAELPLNASNKVLKYELAARGRERVRNESAAGT